MTQRLVTFFEILVIVVAILFVLYWGGVFNPAPAPGPVPTSNSAETSTPSITAIPLILGDLPSPTPVRTHFPTQTYTPAPPTPTFPAHTNPSGLIAFDSTREGNSEVYVINADGSGQTNLTHNAADDAWPSWSPNGKQIAFFSSRSGWEELYVMEADGSNVRQISHLAQTNWVYQEPIRWSPDGQQILMMAYRLWISHTYSHPRLELVQTDGSGTRVVFQEETSYIWGVSWLPVSQDVLLGVADDTTGTCEIRRFSRVIIQYQPQVSFCRTFTPSPDGKQFAVNIGNVNVYNLGDPTPNKLNGTQNADGPLFWSPNGQYIVYSTVSGPYYRAVYTDGSGAIPFAVLFNRNDLSWAPDSQWLTYESIEPDGGHYISIINLFDDAHPILLTNSGNDYAPVWQP